MAYIEPTAEQMEAFASSGIEGPINMLNLLKFKPDGGMEKYVAYGENTAPCLEKVGGKPVYQATGKAAVIGPEQWDMILIVEYPELKNFLDMVNDPEYQKGAHLRTEALEDSRLLCMQKLA